jgi:hypothetical protein
MWIFFILIAAYLFALGKQYIELNATLRQAQPVEYNTRKAGRHLNKHIEKARKDKIDTATILKL